MNELNTVKDKIQKLFSLSTSPSPHEATTALLMAHSLLKKYNLTEADILIKKENTLEEKIYATEKKENLWKSVLLSFLAEFNYCQLIVLQNAETFEYSYKILGKEINILSVNLMADYILSAIKRLVRVIKKDEKENFKRGFVMGIIEQIEIQKNKENKECKDLILSNKKEIEDYLQKNSVEEKSVTPFQEITSGLIEGFKKGKILPLNQQVENIKNNNLIS